MEKPHKFCVKILATMECEDRKAHIYYTIYDVHLEDAVKEFKEYDFNGVSPIIIYSAIREVIKD